MVFNLELNGLNWTKYGLLPTCWRTSFGELQVKGSIAVSFSRAQVSQLMLTVTISQLNICAYSMFNYEGLETKWIKKEFILASGMKCFGDDKSYNLAFRGNYHAWGYQASIAAYRQNAIYFKIFINMKKKKNAAGGLKWQVSQISRQHSFGEMYCCTPYYSNDRVSLVKWTPGLISHCC